MEDDFKQTPFFWHRTADTPMKYKLTVTDSLYEFCTNSSWTQILVLRKESGKKVPP